MEALYDNYFDYTRPRAAVFPPPPPTINALSPAERARLLRSSKKIARVLGTTPRFLDSEVDDLEGVDSFFVTSPSVYRNSADSTSSSSTTLTSTSNTSTSTSITSISSSHTLHRSQKSLPLEDVWPINKHFRPKLSLDTTLESIPASPLTTSAVSTSQSMSRTIPPRYGSRSMSGEPNSLESSPPSPSFMIPSHASARRRKLDRLRRTLGDDVPVCLVFPSSATESDSESGSEPSLSSSSVKTNSEEDLVTPDLSPLSSTSSLVVDSDITKPKPNDNKPLPRPHQTSPRKKKIANTRDSLFLTSKPPSSSTKAAKAKAKAPQSTTHRAPVPPPFPFLPPSLLSMPPGLRITPRPTPTAAHTAPSKIPSTKPTPTPTLSSPSQTYEHPPIVHRRSHSGSSSSSGSGLRVILELEEKDESGWYESDLEGDSEFDFIKEDEVLGAQCRLGDGSAVLYGAPIGKGMGRGLARSYATCAHLGM